MPAGEHQVMPAGRRPPGHAQPQRPVIWTGPGPVREIIAPRARPIPRGPATAPGATAGQGSPPPAVTRPVLPAQPPVPPWPGPPTRPVPPRQRQAAPGPGGQRGAARMPRPPRVPVFADLSGRRPRRMRLIGVTVGVVLCGCLVVMTAGLVGGARAPFMPWSPRQGAGTGASGHAAGGPGTAGTGGRAGAPSATPTPGARPGSPSSGRSASPRPRPPAVPPSAAVTTAPAVTNRASKTPPGLNRTTSPKHTGAP
jgi:hypothetical protein